MQGTLSNGMRWIIAPDPTARSISLQMLTLAGSRMEPPNKRGLAHLVEHLLFDGTTTHTADQLTSLLSQYGGQTNAYTTNDLAVYYCKIGSHYLSELLSFFAEILFTSLFTDESIEREKQVVLQEIAMRIGSPIAKFAMVTLPLNAWAHTPASEPVGGREDHIRSITRADVLSFVDEMYAPQNIVLSLAGNLPSMSSLLPLLEHYYGYTVKTSPMSLIPLATRIEQDQVIRYDLDLQQKDAVVAVAFPYLTPRVGDYVDLLASVLFETTMSRLFKVLRTDHALTYSLTSLSNELRDVGLFGFYFMLDNDSKKIERAVGLTLQVLQELSLNGITPQELEQVTTYLREQRLLALEDTMALASYYGEELILKGQVKSYQQHVDELQTVTIDTVREMANELLSESRMNLAVFT